MAGLVAQFTVEVSANERRGALEELLFLPNRLTQPGGGLLAILPDMAVWPTVADKDEERPVHANSDHGKHGTTLFIHVAHACGLRLASHRLHLATCQHSNAT
eukprot:6620877-Alexandrium_andersonii.AAC.1